MSHPSQPDPVFRTLPEEPTLRRIVSAAFDISVTLDPGDEVVAVDTAADFPHEIPGHWTRASVFETLTDETRRKASELLEEARREGAAGARHLNLSFPGKVELPIEVSAVRIGSSERLLLLGTSLQHIAEMQQRLVQAQQDMEQEYWQYRNAETRYQALFSLTQDPFLLVDWESLEVLQANESAEAIYGSGEAGTRGRPVDEVLAPGGAAAVRSLFDAYRSGESGATIHFTGSDGAREAVLRRVEIAGRHAILVRLPREGGSSARSSATRTGVDVEVVLASLPDGVVVLDEGGRVRWVNPAFRDLAQLERSTDVVGAALGRWLQGPGSGATILLSTITDRGRVRLFRSKLRGDLGLETDVEISGAPLPDGGWILGVRAVGSRIEGPAADSASLATRVSELSGLLGTVGLKELVGSVGNLVERHLLTAALDATGGNRTAAAELLMLSRQTLYTKLREHGLNGDSED